MALDGNQQASALSASASAPATVFQSMDEQDFMLTQTQQHCIGPPVLPQDQGVHARLLSLTKTGFRYELKKDKREVTIGRHPNCEITIEDKRVSGFHLKIYRDDAFRYFVEELSSNGCYINDQHMKKGETKSLQHGDEISLGVFDNEAGKKDTIAAYIFRVADRDDQSGNVAADTPLVADARTANSREAAVGTAPDANMSMSGQQRNRFVNEQWVRDHWDTRTVLGSGNFSEVRLGVNVQSGDKRAVKIIDKKKFVQFQNKRESHLCLNSEADVMLGLNHTGIVRFENWFETETSLYLVMELLEGGDLLQCILEHGCFTEAEARRLFRELCEAVRYLHVKSIVHRDLKPENILLTTKDRKEMHLKIADFGLARTNMKSRDCRTFCGTPHYFAPEVINTFRDKDTSAAGYGKQADMWSLGVILYIMLSGIPPFDEDGLYEQILEGKYEFDVREWTTVSPEAKELVKSLMTVNPKDRLTIHQALDHSWFHFFGPGSCASPLRRPDVPTPPLFSESLTNQPQPMQIATGEPCTKRRRTEDVPMLEAQMLEASGMKVHSPLGA
jgi:serine/threonine protein kinase